MVNYPIPNDRSADCRYGRFASPRLSYDVRLAGAKQVMYAKDKLPIEGFTQEGAPRAAAITIHYRVSRSWVGSPTPDKVVSRDRLA
jgi:hypothetical protein